MSLLNSNSSNIFNTDLSFSSPNMQSFELNFTGTSNCIVANFFDNIPKCLLFSILSLSFPFNSPVFLSKFSILPYVDINFLAVLSPTPGSPGMLSDESPIIPK